MSLESLLLTVDDLSTLLNLSRSTIYMLLSDGRLPLQVHKIGRTTRFIRSEVEAYVAAGLPSAREWKERAGADHGK